MNHVEGRDSFPRSKEQTLNHPRLHVPPALMRQGTEMGWESGPSLHHRGNCGQRDGDKGEMGQRGRKGASRMERGDLSATGDND